MQTPAMRGCALCTWIISTNFTITSSFWNILFLEFWNFRVRHTNRILMFSRCILMHIAHSYEETLHIAHRERGRESLAKYLESFERNKFLTSLKFDYVVRCSVSEWFTWRLSHFKWILRTHSFWFGPNEHENNLNRLPITNELVHAMQQTLPTLAWHLKIQNFESEISNDIARNDWIISNGYSQVSNLGW